MDISTDYSGRQVDLEHFQAVQQPVGSVRLTKTLARTQPRVVAGLQKLVQRYAVLLLSQIETIYLAPEQGTDFLQRILRGGGRSRGHILQTFAFASSDVIAQLRQDDGDEALFGPVQSDEQIKQAQLLDYSVDIPTSTLSLSIYIENQLGTGTKYLLPVPIPRN